MLIRIIQCYHKGFAPVSKLIRWHQKTNYSHYAICYQSITGNHVFVDATSKNVSPYSPENFNKKYQVTKVYHAELEVDEIENQSFFEGLYGTPYSMSQVFGLLINKKGWGRAANAMTCNELVLRYLENFTSIRIDGIDTIDLNGTDEIINEVIEEMQGE